MPIKQKSQCKFCQSDRLRGFTATERMLGLGGHFHYTECLDCGSLQLDEEIDDFSPYYPKDYYSFSTLRKSSVSVKLLKTLRMRLFLSTSFQKIAPLYGYWFKKLTPRFGDRIADVGCGNGQLLYELSVSGFRDLHGFDPFIDRSEEISASLKLWKKRIEDSDLLFDVIMMHHSFEHMEDPQAILSSCYEHLNPGGKLLIRCPVADAEIWKEKGSLWVQLDAPRHLIIPTVEGMRLVAERVGFKLTEIEFDSSDFQFWGTLLYENGERLDHSKINAYLNADERTSLQEKALRYNREGKGDQACFYLVKPI